MYRRDALKIGTASVFFPMVPTKFKSKPKRYPVGFQPFDQATGGIAKGEMLCLSTLPTYAGTHLRCFLMNMWKCRNVAVRQYLGRDEFSAYCCFPQKSLPEIIREQDREIKTFHQSWTIFVICLNPLQTELDEVKRLIVEKEISLVFVKLTNVHAFHYNFGDHNFWLTPRSTTHEGPMIVSEFSTNLIV